MVAHSTYKNFSISNCRSGAYPTSISCRKKRNLHFPGPSLFPFQFPIFEIVGKNRFFSFGGFRGEYILAITDRPGIARAQFIGRP